MVFESVNGCARVLHVAIKSICIAVLGSCDRTQIASFEDKQPERVWTNSAWSLNL